MENVDVGSLGTNPFQGNFSITRGNRVGWIKERSDGSTHCAGFGGSASLDPPYIFVGCPGLLRSYPTIRVTYCFISAIIVFLPAF